MPTPEPPEEVWVVIRPANSIWGTTATTKEIAEGYAHKIGGTFQRYVLADHENPTVVDAAKATRAALAQAEDDLRRLRAAVELAAKRLREWVDVAKLRKDVLLPWPWVQDQVDELTKALGGKTDE